MKKGVKILSFCLVIIFLTFGASLILKTEKFKKLEGYMYTLAAEITSSASSCNATSSNATSSNATSSNATSSNATSSNATSSNATSSNATSSNATSSNATSSNATSCNATSSNTTSTNKVTTETIKVTNTNNNKPNAIPEKEEKEEEFVAKTNIELKNSEITKEKLEEISTNSETQSITIIMDNNFNVSEEVFKAIKGKDVKLTIKVDNNEIIFKGENIQTAKNIDAKIAYSLASEDKVLNEIVKEGIIIDFANNGELPGKAKIRIKVTDLMKKTLNMDTIYVYYYDEETKQLTQLANLATYSEDGFIEFSINHNSKYIFVNKSIEEKEYTVTVTENVKEDNEVSFLESNMMYIAVIGISIIIIIIVTIIVIISRKSLSNETDSDNNDNEENSNDNK